MVMDLKISRNLHLARLSVKKIDVKFKIYDSGVDSTQTVKLLKADNFEGCDAVVSMLSNSFYTALGKASRGAGIPFFILQSSNTQVLDSFSGAGTTALVALRNDRRFIGFDCNPEYCELSRKRVANLEPSTTENRQATLWP